MPVHERSTFNTDAERVAVIGQAIRRVLDDLGEFPCRMDEMTPREARIAGQVCQLVGTCQFILGILPEPGPRPDAEER